MKNHMICFGEILWDVFQDVEIPGGAPMNVAVNLRKLNIQSAIASRVGADLHGDRLLQFLKMSSVPIDLVQTDHYYPTGMVNVNLSNKGNANYDIIFPSSWDFIELEYKLVESVTASKVLLFGSLAARHEKSREVLLNLIELAKTRIFDVNLRAPHYGRETVLLLLSKSNIIKLNEDELKIIGEWLGINNKNIEGICTLINREFNPEMIVVTMGSKGAIAFQKDKVFKQSSYDVVVKDTVGSGDAFLASFIYQQFNGASMQQSLAFACATGSFVASRKGANPNYTEKDIHEVMNTCELMDNTEIS